MRTPAPRRVGLPQLLALLLIAVPLAGQTQEKPRPISKDVAKQAKAEFLKTYKSKNSKIRLAALDRIALYQHPSMEKCIAKGLKDRSDVVRASAASKLGFQRSKSARKRLKGAFQSKKNQSKPEVMRGILEGYRNMHDCPSLKDCKRVFDRSTKEVQREIILALEYRREMETVTWLSRHLKQPAPTNVDSPSNPPASYWRKKVQAWHFWINDIYDVLTDLTGEDFSEREEVQAWMRAGGKIMPLKKKDK